MDVKIFLLFCGVVAAGAVRLADGQYTCNTKLGARRIHESPSRTPFDCVDSRGGNTCRGGQCVAYVKCYCSRAGGKHPGNTGCWKPGTKLTKSDGRCNSAVRIGTAVATFHSGRYYGHAGAFMGCEGPHTIKLYDQYCSKALGLSNYSKGSKHYSHFYVISDSGCEQSSAGCRNEKPGRTACPK